MVCATFLGAAVVTRSQSAPAHGRAAAIHAGPLRIALRVAEQLLLIAIAGFVLTQSYFYASQMLRIGRTSDMAGVPMWIPHGAVALGFALILIVTAWRLIGIVRDGPRKQRPKGIPHHDICPRGRARSCFCCSAFRSSWCC